MRATASPLPTLPSPPALPPWPTDVAIAIAAVHIDIIEDLTGLESGAFDAFPKTRQVWALPSPTTDD